MQLPAEEVLLVEDPCMPSPSTLCSGSLSNVSDPQLIGCLHGSYLKAVVPKESIFNLSQTWTETWKATAHCWADMWSCQEMSTGMLYPPEIKYTLSLDLNRDSLKWNGIYIKREKLWEFIRTEVTEASHEAEVLHQSWTQQQNLWMTWAWPPAKWWCHPNVCEEPPAPTGAKQLTTINIY